MSVSKPSELHRFLESLGTQAKKHLSQNFLIDGNILRKIVKEAEVGPEDVVLEIGAGPGALTEHLLQTGARVIAVEKDPIFASALSRFSSLEVFSGDIRDFPFEKVLSSSSKKAKIVANLPYHLTTPILSLFIPRADLFESVTVMVQDEMAKRMTASPNGADYSSFTVFLNFYSQPRYAFGVSNQCFYPVPKVQSAIVNLKLKEHEKVSSVEAFFQLVRTAFGQRRKMMRSTLKSLYPVSLVESCLCELQLNPLARPENLSLEHFLSLFRLLETKTA